MVGYTKPKQTGVMKPPGPPQSGGFLVYAILKLMKLSAPTPEHAVQQSAQQPVQKRSFRMRRRSSVVEVLDRFFFVFAGIAALWLGAILFMAGWGLNFEYWVYFVVFWVVVAYLGLPRLHRILSYIYVPDYFIGRTRTSDGILGDPVNIGVRGSEAQLHAAMQAAGWTRADDITARSIWRIIISTVRRRSYLHAPVSPLFLFGRQQDFAYQQEVGGNPKQRHHVRFWHCPKGWLLPGGYRVDWLAAGSYDKSVGLSLFTFQITHKVDENIDIERDYITSSVLDHNAQARVAILKDFSTGYHSRNGGGDTIITDGDLPILELAQVPVDSSVQLTTPPRAGLIFDSTKPVPLLPVNHELTPTAELGQAIWSRRPLQLLAGAMLVAVSVIMELVQFVQDMYDAWQTGSAGQVAGMDWRWVVAIAAITSLVVILIEAALVFFVLRGSALARLALLGAASFVIIQAAVGFFLYRQPISFGNSLVTISLHIGILLALSSDAARRFVYRPVPVRQPQ